MIKIVTWNINSIRPRLQHLLDFIDSHAPDILLLQETKVIDENFPLIELEDRGYNIAIHGQKTYNGVAILSKYPLEDIQRNLPDQQQIELDPANAPQARYIEATCSINGKVLRIASAYIPNGNTAGSDKFAYKMRFFECLRTHLKQNLVHEEIMVIGGDYNVAPAEIDVYSPKTLEGSVCFHPDERKEWHKLLNLGLTDAYRALHPQKKEFSWWDYRAGGFSQDKGLRIDHFLLSPEAADILNECSIIRSEREKERPSDHAPVLCNIAL